MFNPPKKILCVQDPGWDSIDDEELYTDEEFQRFESEREQQIKYEHDPWTFILCYSICYQKGRDKAGLVNSHMAEYPL